MERTHRAIRSASRWGFRSKPPRGARWRVAQFQAQVLGDRGRAEARRVATPEFRQQIAEAVAEGISNYAATLAALRQPPDPVEALRTE